MKAILRQGIGAIGVMLLAGLAHAQSAAHGPALTVLWPQTEQARDAHLQIQQAALLESVIQMAEQRMALKGPVTLVIGGGGEPRINNEMQIVVMPYQHLQHIQDDIKANNGVEFADPQLAMDAFVYSLVHQLAHVAIAQQEDTGQWLGEDAVADLTMLTLLEHMPDGDRIAKNALSLFDKQAIGMVRPRDNYWASHSLNAERYWSGVCQLLGSGHMIDEVLPAEQMSDAECGEHYAVLRNSWSQMFSQDLQPIAKGASVASR